MHNIYTGYVFLVDGIGRVRWAGSGEGSDAEVNLMITLALELTTKQPPHIPPPKRLSTPRVGKKFPLD
jgi:ATPase complex subunit ATP10